MYYQYIYIVLRFHYQNQVLKITYFLMNCSIILCCSQIQSEYCHLLFRYLCYIKGQEEARKLYPQYINMLPNLREMSDIMKNKTIKIVPFPSVEEQLSNISLQ